MHTKYDSDSIILYLSSLSLFLLYYAEACNEFAGPISASLRCGRRVARIWKRGGGLFWKSEKWANDLDSNFHWSWISFRRIVRKLRRIVLESSEIERFFPPELTWSPKKKKKKKRSSPKFRVIFRPKSEIQRIFPPKLEVISKKKKKKVFAKFRVIFGRDPQFKGFFLPKLGDLQKKKGLHQNWD